MRILKSLGLVCGALLAVPASADVIPGLKVKSLEIYANKAKIPNMGQAGWSIPEGTPVIVMKAENSSHAHWRFVAYGETMKDMLALWMTAKVSKNPVFCVPEDRGNYWVQCTGTGLD